MFMMSLFGGFCAVIVTLFVLVCLPHFFANGSWFELKLPVRLALFAVALAAFVLTLLNFIKGLA